MREGVIVGRQDLGESDRIVRLLTAEGRVDLVARGARRSRKRFGGALEPGVRVRARTRRGRGELEILEDIDVLGLPRRAREDYDRLVLLGYGCEVLGVLGGQGPTAKLLRLAEVWLELLEGDTQPGTPSRVALEAKALTFAGLTPALVVCPVCGEPLADRVVFDAEAGGGVHGWCGRGPEVAADTLRTLEGLRRTPLLDTAGPLPRLEHPWHLTDFIEHHTARPLRSRSLLP
jgi:DNA repair protein RecO (recombination protein O)